MKTFLRSFFRSTPDLLTLTSLWIHYSKFKFNKGQETSKLYKRELWFLYTVSLLIEIHLPLKFQVNLIPLIHVVVVLCSEHNLSVKITKGNNS